MLGSWFLPLGFGGSFVPPTGGIVFDGPNKRIILDSASVTATEIWSRWIDWQAAHPEWPLAFRQVGGDDLGSGLSIPPYYFLQNGWRVRPMESDHSLVITGNLFVEGGGVPLVNTLGAYNVLAQYTVPVQAQGISTGGSGLTLAEIESSLILAREATVKLAVALSA